MPIFRFPGPICQTKDWYQDINDGTLARTASPVPASSNSAPARGAKAAAKAIASGKCAFVNPQSRGTVHAPKESFDPLRQQGGAAKISTPQAKASYTWPDNSSSAAIEQEIEISSQKFKVIRPTEDNARGKNLPTTQQLADALRAIPSDQRSHTKKIVVSPVPARGTTASRTIAGEAGSGEIFLYPVKDPQSQEDFDNRLTHEAGHNYQEKLWSGAQGVQEWQVAANGDDRRPSPYAAETTGDDFCEFNILYNLVKGTPCEAITKRIYPNRWTKRASY